MKIHVWVAVAAVALLAACGSAPTIDSFTADKSAVPYGGTVTLNWSVKDATSITINGVDVTGHTSATDTPASATQYVLTATNSHGSVTSPAVTVGVTAGMSVLGGTFNGDTLGTTYLVRLRDANGQPQSSDTVVTLSPPGGGTVNVTCAAGQATCFFSFPSDAPQSGTYVANATLGSDNVQSTFTVNASSTLAPAQVTANVDSTGSTVNASWGAVSGASLYEAQVFDLDNGTAISDPADTTQTQAALTLTQSLSTSGNYGVAVTAFAVNPLDPNLPAQLPAPNGSHTLASLRNPASDWQEYGPSDYSGGSLTITVPSLAATEQLAIIPYNLGTADLSPTSGQTNVNLSISGVSPSVVPAGFVQTGTQGSSSASALTSPSAMMASASGPSVDPASWIARRTQALRGHALERARENAALADLNRMRANGTGPSALAVSPSVAAPHATTAAASTTTFCVQQGIQPGASYTRKNATLVKETTHAIFYVDNDDLSEYTPYETGTSTDIWNQLGSLWDNTIYPTDTGTFGAESDIDGNGKLIIFLSHELGAVNQGAITLGYYWAGDVVYAKDTTSTCTNGGSNGADMFYLNDLSNLQGAGYSNSEVISTSYPDTLGHEFQHLINFNQKHLVRTQQSAEDTWINEGLSVTAEDLIGYGWNTASGRSAGNAYLTDLAYAPSSSNPYLRYFNTSFFNWEGDPIGDYQGAHTFFRYFTDRMGPSVLGSIVQTANIGTSNVASALGEPFDQAFGEWTTSLMFSNEVFSPSSRFDFTGTNWDPLHVKLQASSACYTGFVYPNRPGYVQYETFTSGSAQAALRAGGWNAFVTNAGNGGPVTITVTPTQSGVTPYVAVVRYSGYLSDGRQTPCQ